MALYSLTTGVLAWCMEPVIDDVFKNENREMLQILGFGILSVFLIKGFSSYGETITINYIGQSIIAKIQQELFSHLITADLAFHHHHTSSKLVSRCTNDVQTMRNMVTNTLTSLGKDTLTLVCLVGIMFYQDWILASITFFVFPLSFLPIVKLGKRMRRVSDRNQTQAANFMSFLHQAFQGIRLIKSYSMETLEKKNATIIIQEMLRLILKTGRIRAISSPVMETLGGVAIVTVILYGGYQVIGGRSTAGAFFSFITALLMAYEPLKKLANLNANLQEGLAALKRIFEVLDLKPQVVDLSHAQDLSIQKGHILFKKVTFGYTKDTIVLDNLSLEIPAGKKVALVGLSGAGKSTLLNLIPRFYDIDQGVVQIDGRHIGDYTLESLRHQISLVSQDIILFNDTIESNIRYGNSKATLNEIKEAAILADAHDFIQELPEGYSTIVGERGARLSGGQRQRIAIARAILKNAPILLLDEATSSLDAESERQIQKALKNLMKNKTSLVIAHRLATVKDADLIYVLDKGHVVEQGTHETLLKQKGIYEQLCRLQFQGDSKDHG